MTEIQQALALIEAGRTARNLGNTEQALQLYQEAVSIYRTIDQPLRLAHTIRHAADLKRELRTTKAAESDYAEALALYRASDRTAPLDLANTLNGYAMLLSAVGDSEAARKLTLEARDLYQRCGVSAGVADCDRRLL